jgi:hypothetical protein
VLLGQGPFEIAFHRSAQPWAERLLDEAVHEGVPHGRHEDDHQRFT